MIVSKVKYKYLYAWDMMMHSSFSWIAEMQREAARDNAPEDAVYKDSEGNWRRFAEVESEETRNRVQHIVDQMNRKE